MRIHHVSKTRLFAGIEKTLRRCEKDAAKQAPPVEPSPSSPVMQRPGHIPGATEDVVLPNASWRPPYCTEIEAVVTIDKYEGVHNGRNGPHEIAIGHIAPHDINAVTDRSKIDSRTIDLAMNVRSSIDPHGLPAAVPLRKGDKIEVEGEYIPAAHNYTHDGRAVIHFTHSPLGYVDTPDGKQYSLTAGKTNEPVPRASDD